jgi:hypothetical protein
MRTRMSRTSIGRRAKRRREKVSWKTRKSEEESNDQYTGSWIKPSRKQEREGRTFWDVVEFGADVAEDYDEDLVRVKVGRVLNGYKEKNDKSDTLSAEGDQAKKLLTYFVHDVHLLRDQTSGGGRVSQECYVSSDGEKTRARTAVRRSFL